jgi:uncharacterized protein
MLPAGVVPDIFDGSTWVGLIPFRLHGATVLGSPPVPYFGDFAEVNVRLYGVDARGRRGVIFHSLEASRLAAVLAARTLFSIPYFWARTSMTLAEGAYEYRSTRHGDAGAATHIVSRPTVERVVDDPLADFLTARWALFTTRRRSTLYLPNTHEPWPLYRAELLSLDDSLLSRAGFTGLADRAPDSVLFSPGVTTWFGSPR